MSDLRELYQSVILDHNKKPRNFRALEDCNHRAEGDNPLCGDKVTVYALVEDGVIRDVSFQGAGCAISTAAASMMTESIKGRSIADAETLFERYHDLVTKPHGTDADGSDLGKLTVFEGVREFPMRVKCATLAWHTLRSALENRGATVTTE